MVDGSSPDQRRVRSAVRNRLMRMIEDSVGAQLSRAAAEQAAADAKIAADLDRVRESVAQLAASVDAMSASTAASQSQLSALVGAVAGVRDIAAVHLDRTPEQRAELLRARRSQEYADALADPNPLVSVRIATYDRAGILFERTLPSVFAQTYSNLEVIVVGDGSAEDVVRRAAEVTDPRFRFVNLAHRGVYPDNPQRRWQVAGSPAMNHGAQLASGSWIAPLDDDDEFMPEHVETLLRTAREGSFEMVYGRMLVIPRDGSAVSEIGAYPPESGQFGFQAALYMSSLRFFEYETSSWVLDEPGDWNLCRRMLAAGVRIGHAREAVTKLYPAGPQ